MCSNASDSTPFRKAGVADHELEACAKLLTLGEESVVGPNALTRRATSGSALVAASIPPAANLGNHLGDVLVCRVTLVVHHVRQTALVFGPLQTLRRGLGRRSKRFRDHAGDRYADVASLDVREALLSQKPHNEVRR